MLEITPQLQSLLFYIFGIVGGLGIYIFKEFKQTTNEKLKDFSKRIEEARNQKNDYDKQILSLTSTLDRFIDNLGKLEEKFEKFMDTTQKAMERREEYHNHIEKISANLMTQAQMVEFLNKINKLNP